MPEAPVDFETQLRRKTRLAEMMFGAFVKCPTTGTILGSLHGDDKVLCGCRTSNPKVPTERTAQTLTHIIRFCEPATAEAYARQELEARQ